MRSVASLRWARAVGEGGPYISDPRRIDAADASDTTSFYERGFVRSPANSGARAKIFFDPLDPLFTTSPGPILRDGRRLSLKAREALRAKWGDSMRVRRMTEPELEQVYQSIAKAAGPLSKAKRTSLAKELNELSETMLMMWEVWAITPRQAASLLADVSKRARALKQALRALVADQSREFGPFRSLAVGIRDVRREASGERHSEYVIISQLKWLEDRLDEIAAAGKLSAAQRREISRKYRIERGHDKAASILVSDLAGIWQRETGSAPDAWRGADGRYRGKFWNFLRASIVVCREFMGQKAADGALYSRVERLIKEKKRSRAPTPHTG
jgi:hypothetical protein